MIKNMSYTIREAKVEDAPTLIKAEKEIAKLPGFLISRPSELLLELFEPQLSSAMLIIKENTCWRKKTTKLSHTVS